MSDMTQPSAKDRSWGIEYFAEVILATVLLACIHLHAFTSLAGVSLTKGDLPRALMMSATGAGIYDQSYLP